MSVLFVLLPLSVAFAAISVALFIWAVRHGQFDDLETPAVRILFDDESPTADHREQDSSKGRDLR